MNQLQTVLDALESLQRYDGTLTGAQVTEAIAIVKQMMQAEPVARYIGECSDGSLVQLLDDVKKGTDLFAAPQAVPQVAQQAEQGWLPIESVPLDGIEVLLGHPDGSIVVGYWSERQEKFISNEDDVSWALYWMPLTPAPKGAV
jgi:hypothetical protein